VWSAIAAEGKLRTRQRRGRESGLGSRPRRFLYPACPTSSARSAGAYGLASVRIVGLPRMLSRETARLANAIVLLHHALLLTLGTPE
jgi:hypothetical protein